MAYDENLFKRIEAVANMKKHLFQMNMFGGVGFLFKGNMCFGIFQDHLILRLGPEEANRALKRKYVKDFDITGRPMKGWVMVDKQGLTAKKVLDGWIELAIRFVETLPPK